jgi:hypothetical protein
MGRENETNENAKEDTQVGSQTGLAKEENQPGM